MELIRQQKLGRSLSDSTDCFLVGDCSFESRQAMVYDSSQLLDQLFGHTIDFFIYLIYMTSKTFNSNSFQIKKKKNQVGCKKGMGSSPSWPHTLKYKSKYYFRNILRFNNPLIYYSDEVLLSSQFSVLQLPMRLAIVLLVTVLQAQILQIKQKQSSTIKYCQEPSESNATTITLGNCQQSIYYVELGIGTPPQLFNFQLDTTTELMWFPIKNGFQFENSSTFNIEPKKTTAKYHHEKEVAGYAGQDYITIENSNVSAKSVIFWPDEQLRIPFEPEISGVVGMSYSQLPNFLDNAYLKGEIDSPVFSLSMHDSSTSSIIYYNILPESITYNTHYVPVVGSGLWKIKLKGVMANQQDLSYYANDTIIFDSGIDRIHLNEDLYEVIYQQYFKNCTQESQLNLITCPCSQKFPTFSFILDQLQVFVHPHCYSKHIGKDNCMIQIQKSKSIIFGDIFFKDYVITFDKMNKRMGFMGDLELIHFIGSQYFEISQYIVMSLLMFQIGFGFYLLYFLRLQKIKEATARKSFLSGSYVELP